MTILDFREIPQSNLATGRQDDFELFSRDFLEYLGYLIISEPNRGQDGGIDILVEERRLGVGGQTNFSWLVSCKHYAHRDSGKGKAVGIDDEINIGDRVDSHGCDGFIGFYSTIASSGLDDKLAKWSKQKNKEVQIFHHGKIEKYLFDRKKGIVIAKRYFPISMQQWKEEPEREEIINNSLKGIRQDYYEEYIRRKNREKK
jgi:hypothetical protein